MIYMIYMIYNESNNNDGTRKIVDKTYHLFLLNLVKHWC